MKLKGGGTRNLGGVGEIGQESTEDNLSIVFHSFCKMKQYSPPDATSGGYLVS